MPSWTPSQISTSLWLDAADSATVTQSGGTCSQITDKSGNGRTFSQATAGNRPTTTGTQNSKTVLGFDGSRYLTSDSAASVWQFLNNSTGSSIFVACQPATAANPNAGYAILGTNRATSANIGYYLYWDDTDSLSRSSVLDVAVTRGVASVQASRILSSNGFWTGNTFGTMGVVSDPSNATASNRLSARLNGNTALTTNAVTNSPVASDPINTLQIGAGGNNAAPLVGSIGEVIVVSGLISDSNRQKIEGYLAHKWGTTASLPSDHPYKTTAPSYGGSSPINGQSLVRPAGDYRPQSLVVM